MQSEKFKVVSVEVTRQEGKSELCGIKNVFPSIDEASDWLKSQSHTFPADGGYDKHKFVVLYNKDDEKYEGRMDCRAIECENDDLDIRKHMLDTLNMYACITKPEWMKEEVYADFKAIHTKSGLAKEAKDFLEQHEI